MARNLFIIFAVCVVAVAGIVWTYQTYFLMPPTFVGTGTLRINNRTLSVGLAETPDEQTQGLGGRDSLAPNTGMFFVFNSPGFYGIWMKDMKFPIDIIWFDENLRVIRSEERVATSTYPKVFYPQAPARYILETTPGFVDENNIVQGDKATFLKNE